MAAAGPGLEGRPFDSFGGKAFKIALPAGGALTTFVAHDLLTPGSHGFPPFGAWVCANQADELVALNAKGRVVERRGSFRGIAHDGAAKGLLFPASLVFSRGAIYVRNLALPLTEAQGDEPEEDVTTYTVARIPIDGATGVGRDRAGLSLSSPGSRAARARRKA